MAPGVEIITKLDVAHQQLLQPLSAFMSKAELRRKYSGVSLY
jgi:hypothetical protein